MRNYSLSWLRLVLELMRFRKVNLERARSYGFSLGVMLMQPALQFFLFAFYAKKFGPDAYGYYLILMAWAPVALEFVGLGAGEYLIKNVARDPGLYNKCLGHFLAATLVTLPIALLGYALITKVLVGAYFSIWFVVLIGCMELLGSRLLVGLEQSFIALGNMRGANGARLIFAVSRVGFVFIGFFLFGAITPESLIFSGSVGIFLCGMASFLYLNRSCLQQRNSLMLSGLHEGKWFAGNQVIRAGQQNIDRLVLSACVDPATLAIYGVAQRFVQVGVIPVQAFLRTTYPVFFKEGKRGLRHSVKYGLSILPKVVAIASVASVLLIVFSSYVTEFIGQNYSRSVEYLRYLAPTLIVLAFNYVVADALSGADKQRLRTILLSLGVLTQGGLFFFLNDGVQLIYAAYVGLLVSAMLLVVCVWALINKDSLGSSL